MTVLVACNTVNTIDCITSDHNPIDIEHKKMEFDLATNGSIGLESAFGALLTVLPLDIIITKLTFGKTILNIKNQAITENNKVEISLFTTTNKWIFGKENILSKSKNAAFLGQSMKGKSIGIYSQKKLIING